MSSGQFTHIRIDGDGACGYSAQAVVHGLVILADTTGAKAASMSPLLNELNRYYQIQLSYEQLREFLSLLTTRYDLQQLLGPVVYKMQQRQRANRQGASTFQLSTTGEQLADLTELPVSLTRNYAQDEDITAVDRQLHLQQTEMFLQVSATGQFQPNPDTQFVYHYTGSQQCNQGGHYDLHVSDTAFPFSTYGQFLDNSGLYSNNPHETHRISWGYFYSRGIVQYGTTDSAAYITRAILQHFSPTIHSAREVPAAPAVTPCRTASTHISTSTLLPEYRTPQVIDVNTRTNQLLEKVFASRISDEFARIVAYYLEVISNTADHQRKLNTIQAFERDLIARESELRNNGTIQPTSATIFQHSRQATGHSITPSLEVSA